MRRAKRGKKKRCEWRREKLLIVEYERSHFITLWLLTPERKVHPSSTFFSIPSTYSRRFLFPSFYIRSSAQFHPRTPSKALTEQHNAWTNENNKQIKQFDSVSTSSMTAKEKSIFDKHFQRFLFSLALPLWAGSRKVDVRKQFEQHPSNRKSACLEKRIIIESFNEQ